MANQQPPYPMQPQQHSRPPVIDPNRARSPPVGYRPAGTPPLPSHPVAGMPYRPSSTPPPQAQTPPIRPGFPPPGARPPSFPPGSRPPPLMRPPVDRVTSPSAMAPAQPPSSGSPVPQNLPTPTQPLSPTSATAATQSADHHRRKRMYPEQITKAYMDQPAPAPAPTPMYGGQFTGPQFTPATQAQQGFAPAPTPQTYAQPQGYAQPTQPLQQAPVQSPYGQPSMGAMTNQFGNMSMGASVARSVPLMSAPPFIADMDAPAPPINLPQNSALTDSPYANAEASYKCSTLNAIPSSETVLKKSRLPLALVLAPYRTLKTGDDPVPVVTDSVISRCRRCRTYINPYVTFVEGGQRWKCNMCFLLNDVPAAFDFDAQTQQPADRWKRAELNYSCVEFVAPTEYMVRPPQAPAFVFVLDVSYSAVQSGMLATAARTILDSLDRLPNQENRTKFGLITVDSTLHFYNLNSNRTEPQMLVVSDLDDIFLPQPDDLLVNLTESREVIGSLLERLPEMFKDTVNVHNALGTALQAAFKMVSANGGKIICLQSTLPNTGTGALKPREDVKLLGTAKETTLLNAASPFYKSFAVDCSRSQVACDMLIFGGQYSDVATLSCLPHYTGGQAYFYPGFNASRTEDALKFAHEFSELLAEQIGLEAVIRIRASRGLRMSAFHGNFFIRSTDLLALPNVPRDQSYCVEVSIEDDIKTPAVCFQTALLHTTCFGERRIRVITLCLPVTNSIAELYGSANQQAIITYLANKGVERGITSKLDDARDAITNKVVDLLGVYKTHVLGSGQGSTPQLTVPDNLKLLPALALALIKHDGLRQTSQIPTDLRSNAMNLLRTMPMQLLIPFLYPNFYSLHNMPPEAGEISEHGVVFPPTLNLTAEKLEPHGCYLLETGQNMYLWVGRGVVPQLCVDLFDVKSYDGLRAGKITLPTLETPLNKKANMLIDKIREMRRGNYYPQLYLIKEDGDPALRMWFLSHLIEDRTDNVLSYQQFLQLLKDKVSSGSF
ncbi:COPII subunit [Apophysomyces sp. BC1034]|nr:COPII subunit [Apophysomyces sp. BC1015]KAG0183181.1 COPII subunit [Apophysomyces sp. BC1021]KAG0186745.1 COPII subunit [Apophysomyces sp. BC1034]